MADVAVHLEERVLPSVRIRHWICSLPWGLRALLGYDRELCAKVVSTFVGELSRSLKKRAKRELGLASVEDAHTGAVCAVQRTDGALRLNVHLHVLALDGVYVRDSESGALVFEELGTPSHAEVLDVARRTAERVDTLLRKSGRSLEGEGRGRARARALARRAGARLVLRLMTSSKNSTASGSPANHHPSPGPVPPTDRGHHPVKGPAAGAQQVARLRARECAVGTGHHIAIPA
jgi:hypothetical protein